MRKLRNIITYMMMPLLFLWYVGGINLFPHTHIVNGVAVVHSHPFTGAEHQNEDSLLTIDMLCHFHAEANPDGIFLPDAVFFPTADEQFRDNPDISLQDFYRTFYLRGPPQA